METSDAAKKKCSFCGEYIAIDLRRCPFCASLLDIYNSTSVDEMNSEQAVQTVEEDSEKGYFSEQNTFNSNLHSSEKQSDAVVGQTETLQTDISNSTLGNVKTDTYNTVNHPSYKIENTNYLKKDRRPLGNGLKVFLTVIFTLIPGFGQLAGIISGIIFMNSDDDTFGEDKRSFGLALLVACLIIFVVTCISWFIILLALATPFSQ